MKRFKKKISFSDDEDFYTDPLVEVIKRKKLEIDEYNNEKKILDHSLDLETRVILSDIEVKYKSDIIKKIKEVAFVEANKYFGWVNNLLKIPFGKYSNPVLKSHSLDGMNNFLEKSRKILDDVVYKQDECKESILDFCCKIICNPESKGSVLAIQSSKGMGKTRIIRQGLSKILNRPFFSINFGGLTDPAILTGHDFTYTGSKYGRICQILMDSGVMDPIIYLDEIDKIGNDSKSKEVFGVLTHLLDSEQNNHFTDNYFQGISIDLSRVLFIISFNDLENVNHIVSDRMRIIKVPDLTQNDKKQIIESYIIPDVIFENNITNEKIKFSDDAREYILSHHNLEPGMRQIKKTIESITERVNRFCLSGKMTYPVIVDAELIKKLNIINLPVQNYNHMYI